uniref:Ig-like domain-containing protein n=1 Tax=Ditylenchus dipsaci TaxID=166011 RepID=A0A915CWE7_9BILA
MWRTVMKANIHCIRATSLLNKGGKTSEQFMVEVLEPPQMETTEPQKLTKREGDLLTLVCPVKNEDVEVDSELRVTWTKDGRPLEPTDSLNYEITNEGRRLQLTSSSISDAGHYKCVASNRAGQSHVKFHVEILCTHMASEFCRQLEHRHMIEYKKDYDRRRHIYESQATRRRETHFGRQKSTNTDPEDRSTVLKKVHKRTTATPRTFMTPQPRKSFENFPVQPTYADFSVEFDPLIPTLQPPISPTGLVYPVNGHRIYDYLTLNSSPVVPNRRYRVYSAPSGLVHRDVAETRLMKPLGNRYFSTEVQYSGPGQGFVGTLKARKHVNNLRANLKTLLKKRRRRHHFAMDDLYSSFFVSSNSSVIRA